MDFDDDMGNGNVSFNYDDDGDIHLCINGVDIYSGKNATVKVEFVNPNGGGSKNKKLYELLKKILDEFEV